MSIPALLNVNQLAARKGAHELEFAVKKVHSLDTSKGGPEGYLGQSLEESKILL